LQTLILKRETTQWAVEPRLSPRFFMPQKNKEVCTMAAITGKNATIKIGKTPTELTRLLGANNWQITVDVSMIEDTDFETEGWVTNLAGNKSWTGTIDFSFQIPDAATGQRLIEEAALNGTLLEGEFTTDGVNGYKGQF